MCVNLSCGPKRCRPNTTGSWRVRSCFLLIRRGISSMICVKFRRLTLEVGGPRVNSLDYLERIFWMLKNVARWKDLPEKDPSPAACWRPQKAKMEAGLLVKAWEKFISIMDPRRRLDWSQAMGDGSFSPARGWLPSVLQYDPVHIGSEDLEDLLCEVAAEVCALEWCSNVFAQPCSVSAHS